MKIKAVLFDLDGTLVDTAPDIIAAVNTIQSHYKKATIPEEKIRPYISLGSVAILSHALDFAADDPRMPELKQKLFDAYIPIMTKRSGLYAGLELLLTALKNKHIPWGIVTNKPAWVAKDLIAQLGLTSDCAILVGPETTGRRKPDPEGLLYACRHLHLAPQQVLYVGDCEHDIVAAQHANMPTVAVTWGYYLPEDDPYKWNADVVCDSTQSLLQYVEKVI